MALCRRAKLWGGDIPLSVVRLALVHACANAAAAARLADRDAARASKDWLDTAASGGASLAHRIVSVRSAVPFGNLLAA